MNTELFLKNFAQELKTAAVRFQETLLLIRSNRPSPEMVGNLKVNYFDQWCTIKQLGTVTVFPPRGIQVTVWDKGAVGIVTKAIEDAKMGLTASADGLTIRAALSALSDERREELAKAAKGEAEESRIRVRAARDEAIKKLKAAENGKQISEDVAFKTKEKLQKIVDETNKEIEAALHAKLMELQE